MNISPLRGLIAATITPFHADGSVNLDAIGPMLDRLIELGIAGFYVCGSTGEGMSLTSDEQTALRKGLDKIGYFKWCGIEVGAVS